MPKSRGTWHIVTSQRAPHQAQREMASTNGLIEAFAPVLVAFHPSSASVNHWISAQISELVVLTNAHIVAGLCMIRFAIAFV